MRQFSIYALSINQIVFTSSRRTSLQGEGEATRVEGGRHTHSSEGGFKVRLLDFTLRCFDEFIEKLRDIWEVFGLICRGYARSTLVSQLISGMCDSYERTKFNLIKVVENNNNID